MVNNIRIKPIIGFSLACMKGHIETAKYLYGVVLNDRNIGIPIQRNHAFILSCWEGYIEIAKWLCTLDPCLSIGIEYNKIKSWKIHDFKKTLTEAINNRTIDSYYHNVQKIDFRDCPRCLEDVSEKQKIVKNKLALLDCTHIVCLECYIQIHKCPFNCVNNAMKNELLLAID